MIVPFKNKLSYVWERITGKDRIYSHVIEKRGEAEVAGHSDQFVNKKIYLWLKGTKVEGTPNAFVVSLCQYHVFARPNWEEIKNQASYNEVQLSGVYNRSQVKQLIMDWEVESLQNERVYLPPKQPFSGYVN